MTSQKSLAISSSSEQNISDAQQKDVKIFPAQNEEYFLYGALKQVVRFLGTKSSTRHIS